jgi:hypothetical protein
MEEFLQDFERRLSSLNDDKSSSSGIERTSSSTIKDPRSLWRKFSKEEISLQRLRQRCTLETLSEVSINEQLFLGLAISEKDVVYHRRTEQINKIPAMFDRSTGLIKQSSSFGKFKLNNYDGVFDLKVKSGTWADLVITSTVHDAIRIKFTRLDEPIKLPDGKIEQKGKLILEGCNLDNPLFISAALANRCSIETDGTEIEFTGFRCQNEVCRQIDTLNPGLSVSMFETGQAIEISLYTHSQPISYFTHPLLSEKKDAFDFSGFNQRVKYSIKFSREHQDEIRSVLHQLRNQNSFSNVDLTIEMACRPFELEISLDFKKFHLYINRDQSLCKPLFEPEMDFNSVSLIYIQMFDLNQDKYFNGFRLDSLNTKRLLIPVINPLAFQDAYFIGGITLTSIDQSQMGELMKYHRRLPFEQLKVSDDYVISTLKTKYPNSVNLDLLC